MTLLLVRDSSQAMGLIFLLSLLTASSLAAARLASSLCRKHAKLGEYTSAGWEATRVIKRSSARRRDSTKSGVNLPKTCLSGRAGIIAPGQVIDN